MVVGVVFVSGFFFFDVSRASGSGLVSSGSLRMREGPPTSSTT